MRRRLLDRGGSADRPHGVAPLSLVRFREPVWIRSVRFGDLNTGKSFAEVEAMLDEMVKKGYAEIDNDAKTGVVIYRFGGLA